MSAYCCLHPDHSCLDDRPKLKRTVETLLKHHPAVNPDTIADLQLQTECSLPALHRLKLKKKAMHMSRQLGVQNQCLEAEPRNKYTFSVKTIPIYCSPEACERKKSAKFLAPLGAMIISSPCADCSAAASALPNILAS